jgi:hypothetical protein
MANQTKLTYDAWLGADVLDVGRRLMIGLGPEQQVARAKAVLDLCRSRLPSVPAVDHVAALAAEPARWTEAHAAFRAVRDLTLREERKRSTDAYRALLYVAEIAAKIIYNASGASAPFDSDSSWWLASNTRNFVRALNDESFSHQAWHALRHAKSAAPDSAP